MNTPLFSCLAAALLAGAPIQAASIGSAVTLELRTERGPLALYPAGGLRAYAEAVQGASYRIVVHNNLDRRVGLVIAVDGRNIISGARSWLKGDERMYVLAPFETREYAGWRTAQDKENRFYFTSVEDSYAGAFKDTSAMGVVAMAVYPERLAPARRPSQLSDAPAPAVAGKAQSRMAESAPQAGTGYGEEVYSPSIAVAFDPEPQAREESFIKYEWRATLIKMGVIRDRPAPRNRLWDPGFAPPPPRL